MDVWNLIAERKIQEAMEEGAFDHLEGAGAPLPDDVNPYEDPAHRMAHRLMKNAGVTPAWIAEGRELERDLNHLRTAAGSMNQEERRRRVAELNRRIVMFNLKAPVRTAHKLLVPE